MRRFALGLILVASIALAGCGEKNIDRQAKAVDQHAAGFKAYLPHNDVELRNYNDAQKLYDSPNTIIWCSTTWGNPSSPIITVPVTGKLTSSTTTFFRPEQFIDRGNYSWQVGTARSVDGLFHPNPPPYRYGFTPGGQYVDFFNMPTLCTTALTKFQRQETKLSTALDPAALSAQSRAEKALRSGDKAGAQKALEALGG